MLQHQLEHHPHPSRPMRPGGVLDVERNERRRHAATRKSTRQCCSRRPSGGGAPAAVRSGWAEPESSLSQPPCRLGRPSLRGSGRAEAHSAVSTTFKDGSLLAGRMRPAAVSAMGSERLCVCCRSPVGGCCAPAHSGPDSGRRDSGPFTDNLKL